MDQSRHLTLTVVFYCVVWYLVSSGQNILNKLILQRFPYPMTVAMFSLASIPLYSRPLLKLWNVSRPVSRGYVIRYILPIAAGKAIAVATANFSLYKVPVSYAHTVKATMPLFAVLSARLLLSEKQTAKVYISLLPIVLGVVIASFTELSFNLIGLLSSLGSTFTYALLNSFVKRVLQDTSIHPILLLSMNAQIAAVLFLPFWALNDGLSIYGQLVSDSIGSEASVAHAQVIRSPGVWLCLALSGFLSFFQNVCAFSLIHKLSALSYAVANATKRITVISLSLITLKNPVSMYNVFGMGLAIIGVFAYNRAKHAQQRLKRTLNILPSVMTYATLSDATVLRVGGDDDDDIDESGTRTPSSTSTPSSMSPGGSSSRTALFKIGDSSFSSRPSPLLWSRQHGTASESAAVLNRNSVTHNHWNVSHHDSSYDTYNDSNSNLLRPVRVL